MIGRKPAQPPEWYPSKGGLVAVGPDGRSWVSYTVRRGGEYESDEFGWRLNSAALLDRIDALEQALRECARHCASGGCEVETRESAATTGCSVADAALAEVGS